MIREACAAIQRVEERERRIREIKYGRRNKMRYIDRLLDELELLNLAEQSEVPEHLAMALDRLLAESRAVDLVHQPRPGTVMEAMALLYEIQDSLMLGGEPEA